MRTDEHSLRSQVGIGSESDCLLGQLERILESQDSWWTIPVARLVIVFSAVLVLSCVQIDRHTETDADNRCTPTTVVGVSRRELDVWESQRSCQLSFWYCLCFCFCWSCVYCELYHFHDRKWSGTTSIFLIKPGDFFLQRNEYFNIKFSEWRNYVGSTFGLKLMNIPSTATTVQEVSISAYRVT